MELHINEDYIMLNQRLQYEILSGKIDKEQTVYYTMKNDLINEYYVDINDAPGPIAGMLRAMDLSETLFVSQFK